MVTCNICGGAEFEPGPNGRLTPSGDPLRCSSCYSLERHRSVRECLSRVPHDFLSWRRAIQFAPDRSLNPAWFRSYEESQFGGENSLDLQDIARPSGSYDFISLSSVLEFIPDDRQAFTELIRIASSDCVIHCTFTPAATNTPTHHYGEQYGTFGRYHLYGSDLTDWFSIASHRLNTLATTAVDPVTGVAETIHFFCRRQRDSETLRVSLTTGTPPFDVSIVHSIQSTDSAL